MGDIRKDSDRPTVSGGEQTILDAMSRGFGLVRADISVLSYEVDGLKKRIELLETHRGEVETWRRETSIRTKEIVTDAVEPVRREASSADLSLQAALSEEINARETLAKKVETIDSKQDLQLQLLKQLVSVTRNPYVRHVATAIGTAILTWFSVKGWIHL